MLKAALLTSLLVVFVGCSGNPSTGPSDSSGTPPYNQVFPGSLGANPATGWTRISFTAPRSGTLTLSLTWSEPAANLDLYLAPSTCVDLDPKPACGILASSTATSGTSERLNRAVAVNDRVAFFVDEPAPHPTLSYTLTVTIQ